MTRPTCLHLARSAASHSRATALRDRLKSRFDDMTEAEAAMINDRSADC